MKRHLRKTMQQKEEIKYELTQGYHNSRPHFQTNKKLFVTVNPKKSCRLEFSDHLWLPFIDQPHSDVVIFAIIYFQIYQNL